MTPDRHRTTSRLPALLAGAGCIGLILILGSIALDLETPPDDGTPPVAAALDRAGVSQPVTAVLLNFRGYDTWLEVGVLAVVVLSVLAVNRTCCLVMPTAATADEVLAMVSRLLFPFMVLVAGYLLWAGTRLPGGAFQAGAVLGASGVLLHVAGTAPWLAPIMHGRAFKTLALLGFLLLLIFSATTMLTGRAFLEYPEHLAGPLILIIEAGLTISIGWTLAFLFLGTTPRAEGGTRVAPGKDGGQP